MMEYLRTIQILPPHQQREEGGKGKGEKEEHICKNTNEKRKTILFCATHRNQEKFEDTSTKPKNSKP
jgi:hypothetical protein